jgi:hypothetical protein
MTVTSQDFTLQCKQTGLSIKYDSYVIQVEVRSVLSEA